MIMNNGPLDLAGDDNEDITVKVVSKKPGDTVAFALDGVKGGILPNPFTFKLNKAAHDPERSYPDVYFRRPRRRLRGSQSPESPAVQFPFSHLSNLVSQ